MATRLTLKFLQQIALQDVPCSGCIEGPALTEEEMLQRLSCLTTAESQWDVGKGLTASSALNTVA